MFINISLTESVCNKLKNKQYHIDGTFSNSIRKIEEREVTSIPLTHIKMTDYYHELVQELQQKSKGWSSFMVLHFIVEFKGKIPT